MKLFPLIAFALTAGASLLADSLPPLPNGQVPQTVQELWCDYDPRKEPLDIELVREWKEDGATLRYVRYLIGTFKGRKAYMAAFYGFPAGAKEKLPALLHMHGGGQRAFLHEVKYYVARGYVALSVNWGGREMENAQPGAPNTDWGAVDPTQQNVPGYFNLKPGEKYLDPVESPRNCNWFLLTIGCRRGITFLERQPEVDAHRIGIYGHSMGGNLTMYVAGTDDRVHVAAPSVGGQGFRTEPHEMLGGRSQQENIHGDVALFTRTLGFENYAPRVRCPLLDLSASNDFHAWMDDVYRTNEQIPNQPLRYVFAPHFNHRFTPEAAITRPLWLDQYLRGTIRLPQTPRSTWTLKQPDGVPVMRVTPDAAGKVTRVDIYYAVDPDPRARFWRDAGAQRTGDDWKARLPVLNVRQPLYAVANVYYELKPAQSPPHATPTGQFCLSSLFHSAKPAELEKAGVRGTDRPALVIDDFARGWHDWYALSPENRDHWQFWTRKITDPKWRGSDDAKLAIRVKSEQPNQLVVVLIENEWRSYRGPKHTFVAEARIQGGTPEQIVLAATDFKNAKDGAALKNWSQLDQLGLCGRYTVSVRGEKDAKTFGLPKWQGAVPVFERIEWIR